MKILKEQKYSYNDLTIVPAVVSEIRSRKECNPYTTDEFGTGYLPIFTAPMSAVINDENYQSFLDNEINVVIPRTVDIARRKELLMNGEWVAFSLAESQELIFDSDLIQLDGILRVCIDLANGHMIHVLEAAKKLKDVFKDSIYIMVGNIANPDWFLYVRDHNYAQYIDYVRCSIGSGGSCLTANQTCVHYPIASLINECAIIKNNIPALSHIKIIADGGIKCYGDIITALACGADYVMIGGLFAQMYEAAGPIEYSNSDKEYINDFVRFKNSKPGEAKRLMYGMSTKIAQKEMGNKVLKTAEGNVKYVDVLYTLNGWCENFKDYLRSAMSYSNARTLDEFKEKSVLVVNSVSEQHRVEK